jgi:hypothetical protein
MYVVQIFAFFGWMTTERQFQGLQSIPTFRNHVVTITKITPDQCFDSVQVFKATI